VLPDHKFFNVLLVYFALFFVAKAFWSEVTTAISSLVIYDQSHILDTGFSFAMSIPQDFAYT